MIPRNLLTRTGNGIGAISTHELDPTCILFHDFETGVDRITGKTLILGGGVSLDTINPKFGLKSLKLPGTLHGYAYHTGDAARYSLGTGEFTIDFWVNPAAQVAGSAGASSGNKVCQFGDAGTNNAWYITLKSGIVCYGSWVGGFGSYVGNQTVVPINAWTHVAIVRSGTQVKTFINGMLDTILTVTAGATLNCDSGPVEFGSGYDWHSGYNYGGNFQGKLDNFRILKGRAEWLDNFDLPNYTY